MKKVQKLTVVATVLETNENSELVGEEHTNQIELYRASTPDVWAYFEVELEKVIAALSTK